MSATDGRGDWSGASGMPYSLRPTLRKRRRILPEEGPAAITTSAEEASPTAAALQSVLQEVQQIRREMTRQQRGQEDLLTAIRLRDAEIVRLQERLRGISAIQLSPSNNICNDASNCPARNSGVASACEPFNDSSNRSARNSSPANAINRFHDASDRFARNNSAAGENDRVASAINHFDDASDRFARNNGAASENDRVACAAGFATGDTHRVVSDGENSRANRENSVGAAVDSLLGVRLKPDTFDGSAPLREYLAQFALIASANRWEGGIKTAVLASCLRGKARAVLEGVQNFEELNFTELRTKLELRFGEAHSLQHYYTQFTNRRQKFGENVASFGSDIERLARLAYPECTEMLREKIACAQFVSALSDGFVKRALQLEGITSLRIAIERAKAIKLIQENSFGRKFENFSFAESKGRKNGQSENKEKSEGVEKNKKIWKNKNVIKDKNKKECWGCGKEGHFRYECPGRAEAENKE